MQAMLNLNTRLTEPKSIEYSQDRDG